jgi:hypothetical protein
VAAVTAPQLTVAVVAPAVDDKPAGATHTTCVVNCADAAAPVPDAQVAITLQSYKLPDAKPVKLAEVAVCAVEKLVHVEEEFNL